MYLLLILANICKNIGRTVVFPPTILVRLLFWQENASWLSFSGNLTVALSSCGMNVCMHHFVFWSLCSSTSVTTLSICQSDNPNIRRVSLSVWLLIFVMGLWVTADVRRQLGNRSVSAWSQTSSVIFREDCAVLHTDVKHRVSSNIFYLTWWKLSFSVFFSLLKCRRKLKLRIQNHFNCHMDSYFSIFHIL